ncbi:MAG: hypothetical protein LAN63_05225 [Acidobacteriia bacterium]|nr:hypothetical protein [Terriglobia bacterium]
MGVFAYNACWLLLAIPPSMVWLRGFPSDVGKRRRLLVGVLAALGMLGFVFSALTPDDDLVQQEFTQSQESSLQSPSKAAASDLDGRVSAVYLISAAALPAASRKVIEHVSPLPEKSAEILFPHAPGDRSPPVLS